MIVAYAFLIIFGSASIILWFTTIADILNGTVNNQSTSLWIATATMTILASIPAQYVWG